MKMRETTSLKFKMASGLPDLQMTGPAEVHLICRCPDLLIRRGDTYCYIEVFRDICRGFTKALPDLSPLMSAHFLYGHMDQMK